MSKPIWRLLSFESDGDAFEFAVGLAFAIAVLAIVVGLTPVTGVASAFIANLVLKRARYINKMIAGHVTAAGFVAALLLASMGRMAILYGRAPDWFFPLFFGGAVVALWPVQVCMLPLVLDRWLSKREDYRRFFGGSVSLDP